MVKQTEQLAAMRLTAFFGRCGRTRAKFVRHTKQLAARLTAFFGGGGGRTRAKFVKHTEQLAARLTAFFGVAGGGGEVSNQPSRYSRINSYFLIHII